MTSKWISFLFRTPASPLPPGRIVIRDCVDKTFVLLRIVFVVVEDIETVDVLEVLLVLWKIEGRSTLLILKSISLVFCITADIEPQYFCSVREMDIFIESTIIPKNSID